MQWATATAPRRWRSRHSPQELRNLPPAEAEGTTSPARQRPGDDRTRYVGDHGETASPPGVAAVRWARRASSGSCSSTGRSTWNLPVGRGPGPPWHVTSEPSYHDRTADGQGRTWQMRICSLGSGERQKVSLADNGAARARRRATKAPSGGGRSAGEMRTMNGGARWDTCPRSERAWQGSQARSESSRRTGPAPEAGDRIRRPADCGAQESRRIRDRRGRSRERGARREEARPRARNRRWIQKPARQSWPGRMMREPRGRPQSTEIRGGAREGDTPAPEGSGQDSYSLIGITTYRVCVNPGAWIRQLLFASVSPISTLSPSIALRASSK